MIPKNKGSKKKIILFTIGNIDHPSSRIRGIQYIPYLEKAGYEVKWIPRIPRKPINRFQKIIVFPIWKRVLTLFQILIALLAKPNLFIIQKVFFPSWVMSTMKSRGSNIIYDFDDAVYLSADLVNVDIKLEKKTIAMLRHSSQIIVSTKFLNDWCNSKGFKSNVITTPVDIFSIKKKATDSLTIGWIGSITNTVHLEELRDPLQELSKSFNFRLLLIGANHSFKIDNVNVIHKNWSLEKEVDYLSEMDIGIMPLLKNNYSKGKGGYKIFVYMGAGLPVIASPIGINKEIVKTGITGFLASSTDEWIKALSILLSDKKLRNTMGSMAKRIAIDNYSREVCSKQFINIVNSITQHNT